MSKTVYEYLQEHMTDAENKLMTETMALEKDIKSRIPIATVDDMKKGDFIINITGQAYQIIRVNKQSVRVKGHGYRNPADRPYKDKFRRLDIDYLAFKPHYVITKSEIILLMQCIRIIQKYRRLFGPEYTWS
jgi:mRNA-degrading endonuclease HigB of HigAB toxin-antitoxin module